MTWSACCQLAFHDRARASREMGELSRDLPPATLNRLDLLLSRLARPRTGSAILRALARAPAQLVPAPDALDRRPALSDRGLHAQPFPFRRNSASIPSGRISCSNPATCSASSTPSRCATCSKPSLPPGLPAPLEFASFRRRQIAAHRRSATCWAWARCPKSPASCPRWPTPSSKPPTSASTSRSGVALRCTANPHAAKSRTSPSSRSGKLGGSRAQLQLRHRPDVPVLGERRNRGGPCRHHQQGILQARRESAHRAAFHLHRRRACAIAWIFACAPTAAWARSASRSKARANTTRIAPATGNCRC